jgi:hypothetical protein
VEEDYRKVIAEGWRAKKKLIQADRSIAFFSSLMYSSYVERCSLDAG